MERLWEYRIKYNSGKSHSAMDNYHYFNAEDASTALAYHFSMMEKHGFKAQLISVEKKCPYANKWVDETDSARNILPKKD